MVTCHGCGLEVGSVELENEHNIRRTIVMALRANVAPDKGIDRYFAGRHNLINKMIKTHIDDIKDLSIGSMIYLLGQYGSGKTTTLKMLRETSCKLPGSFVYSSINILINRYHCFAGPSLFDLLLLLFSFKAHLFLP